MFAVSSPTVRLLPADAQHSYGVGWRKALIEIDGPIEQL
jgi:hypothetical protein